MRTFVTPHDPLVIREALTERRRLTFDYVDEKGRPSERTVRPLGVFFWGRTWTLAAWCETRSDFRNFRIDRVGRAQMGDAFSDEPGKTLREMLAAYGPDAVRMLDR